MSRAIHRLALAALVGTVFAGGAAAADFPTTPPPPGPAPALHIPTPIRQTLANGLEVISVRRADLPLVTARLLIRRGGEMDPPGLAGLASLTANLLTKGAAGLTAPQIAASAEALGGSLDASAGWDESSVGITVTTPKLDDALALLADVVRRPTFAQDELARARKQAEDELQLMLSRPTALASLASTRAVFGDGAYGHPRIGTPASLQRIARADVQRLHDVLYRPDNAILVLTGDITPEQALALAQRRFGDWARPAAAVPPVPAATGHSSLPAVLVIDQPGGGQAGVVAAHAAPRRSDGQFYVGTVANAVLGGSYSARLNEEIRIKRGLSYGAGSQLAARRDEGLWAATTQTKNESAAEVVGLVMAEIGKLATAPADAAELASRRAVLVGSFGRSLETVDGLGSLVAGLANYGLPLTELRDYPQKVRAVTAGEIETAVKATLPPDRMSLLVVGDAKTFLPALQAKYPKLETVPLTSLNLDAAALK